jgi:hypothetical protein
MTSKQIQKDVVAVPAADAGQSSICYWLQEIAYQLALMNERSPEGRRAWDHALGDAHAVALKTGSNQEPSPEKIDSYGVKR